MGRRSGEQRAKDGRYQTDGLRSVDKRTSAGQSGDCHRFWPDARPFIGVCRRPTVRCPRPLWNRPTVGRLLPDSVPITKSKKKKNRRTTGENITWHLRQKMISLRENRQNRTQRRPMVHRQSPHMSYFGLADVGRLLVWEMWLRYKNKNFRLRLVATIRLSDVWQSVIPSGLCILVFTVILKKNNNKKNKKKKKNEKTN